MAYKQLSKFGKKLFERETNLYNRIHIRFCRILYHIEGYIWELLYYTIPALQKMAFGSVFNYLHILQ